MFIKYHTNFMTNIITDDTTSDVAGRQLELVIKHLETDANAIPSFMASNGLVANSSKTFFMLLNFKEKSEKPRHRGLGG